MANITLSIIAPTYNEADNIKLFFEAIQKTMRNTSIVFEVIFVDDNSPDLTWQVAQKLSQKHLNLHVIRRMKERGLGSAVLTGMAMAQGNIFVVIDSDMQHDETIISKMVQIIQQENFDLVVGSRKISTGSYGKFSALRKLISRIGGVITRFFVQTSVQDTMSGFFAITRDLYEKKIEKIHSLGFKILLEFLSHSPEAKITEIPYSFRNRAHGETKLSGGVIRHFFMALWDLRFGHIVSSTFMLYSGVGFIGIFFNLGGFAFGEYLKLPHISLGLFPSIEPIWLSVPFGIEISIVSNYFLNNYITFYENRKKGIIGHIKGFTLFQLISIIGVFIQWSVFQVLSSYNFIGEIEAENFLKYFYNCIGILIATANNYFLNINHTWKKS